MQRRRTSAIKKTVSEDKTVVESQLDKMSEKNTRGGNDKEKQGRKLKYKEVSLNMLKRKPR